MPTQVDHLSRSSGRLSIEDARDRIRCWQHDGDAEAREEVLRAFLPMARRLANRYRTPGEMDDLYQVASVGLLGAIDRFDVDRGVSFVSFAVPTILGEIKRYFRNTAWAVHVPRGAQEMAQRVQRAARELETRHGRPPRVSDLAEYLEVELEEVLLGLDAADAHYADSLDAPAPGAGLDAEDGMTIGDRIGGDDGRFDLVDLKLSLPALLPSLPFLERRALQLRQSGGLTQQQIARQLGCSQMQVSRLLRRANDRLKDQLTPTA